MRMCLLDSGAALVVCGAAEESGACGLADPRSLARSLETMRRRGALRAGTRVFLPLAVEKQQAAWTAVAELVWNVCGQFLEPDAFSSEVNGASAQHMNSQRITLSRCWCLALGLPSLLEL
ncbi:uncharacterized protein isoform X2 [Macaca fascicularis]|uniref:uncharacterized protein isoform X2 n=1 Tax=Macaca fascicularis TaxID=9541 RepID=UPI0032B0448C